MKHSTIMALKRIAAMGLVIISAVSAGAMSAWGQAVICDGDSWTVGNEGDYNAAIACFNSKIGAGTYTITLAADIPLTVGTSEINNATVGAALVVEGDGYKIDGQGIDGVRPVTVGSGTTVTINNMIVTRGKLTGVDVEGGGILNKGSLTINTCTVTDNLVTGTGATGTIGGGISNWGSLMISGSTISNNRTLDAGNTNDYGGGIGNYPGGHITLKNSTISRNQSVFAGGGIFNRGVLSLDSTTIAENGAARGGNLFIPTGGKSTVSNSVLANAVFGLDCEGANRATVIDNGHNLVGTQTGTCQFQDGVNGTRVGVDPLLGPLADNGGLTRTHALLPGSPATDAGETTLTTDQRGVPRPFGAASDIGAFEYALGTVIIRKSTAPAGGSGFSFTSTFGAFTLKDGGKQVFHNIAPGTYTVTEEDPSGLSYALSGLTCQDSLPSGQTSTVDIPTRTATLKVDAGETVTCRFNNAQNNAITVETITVPDSTATFSFSGTLGAFDVTTGQGKPFSGLSAGTYTITEADPTASGYQLTAITCTESSGAVTSGDPVSRSVTLDLAAGQELSCSFVNSKLASFTVVKLTDGTDGTFSFTSTIPGRSTFSLTTSGGGALTTFSNVAPGTYSIAETGQMGWVQALALCSGGQSPSAVKVGVAEDVGCVFINIRTVVYLPLVIRNH